MSEDFSNYTECVYNPFEDDGNGDTYFDVKFEDAVFEGSSESSGNYESFSTTAIFSECHNGYSLRKSISTGNMVFAEEEERKIEIELDKNERTISKCDAHIITVKEERAVNKYMSTAELVSNFWLQPCDRFLSKPNTKSGKPKCTMPRTPQLNTQKRTRPVTAMSREQLEELEMIEAQKHFPKARPVNKKILLPPKVQSPSEKKHQITIVKPFNLTEVQPKKTEQAPEIPQFHARPIPRALRVAPKLRVPFKPKTKQTSQKDDKKKLTNKSQPPAKELKRTVIQPFSFDQRDKNIIKNKEQYIQKILEEEKKAREFHAAPIPKAVLKTWHKSSSSIKSAKSDELLDNMASKTFKASFPKVLHQEPFIPKKPERRSPVLSEFQLNTEIRAKERQEYEKMRKQKEEEEEQKKLAKKQAQMEREQREIQRLRKEAEFKANPIRHFKELQIRYEEKVTIAQSPNFKSKKLNNKENRLIDL